MFPEQDVTPENFQSSLLTLTVPYVQGGGFF